MREVQAVAIGRTRARPLHSVQSRRSQH